MGTTPISIGEKLNGQLNAKHFFGYNPDLKPFPYDPAKAKALLAEAGYPNGFDTTLRSPSGHYLQDKELVEAVSGQLQKVGVRATVDITDWSVYISKMFGRPGLGPMSLMGWTPLPDALHMMRVETSGSLVKQHSWPEFDAVMAEADRTMDEAKRAQLYRQATQMLYDRPPVIYLHQQMAIYGMKKAVTGFTATPDEYMWLHDLTRAT